MMPWWLLLVAMSSPLDASLALLEQGQSSEAVEALKLARQADPADTDLMLALARAYLEDGNPLWALLTVQPSLPADCTARALAAIAFYRQGEPRAAAEALAGPPCPRAWQCERQRLLRRFVDRSDALTDAIPADICPLAREDRWLWDQVYASGPTYRAPLVMRGEVEVGWAANALLGAPTDEQDTGAPQLASPFSRLSLTARAELPQPVALFAEAQLRGELLTSTGARRLSYIEPGALLGLHLALGSSDLELAYHPLVLVLAQDPYDGAQHLLYESHRAELTMSWSGDQLPGEYTVYGGGGWRGFSRNGRTRSEVDGGVAGLWSLAQQWQLLGLVTGRRFAAVNQAYDLGGIIAMVGVYGAWRGWRTRHALQWVFDDYPASAGFFDPVVARRDQLVRYRGSVSYVLDSLARLGVRYEWARRSSNIVGYRFSDQRVMLVWRYQLEGDYRAPEVRDVGTVPLPWPRLLAAGADDDTSLDERIGDLIRQDEAISRSSSCVD